MTGTDFVCLTPMMIIAGAPMLLMLIIGLSRNFRLVYAGSLLGYVAAFLSVFLLIPHIPHKVSSLLLFDQYSLLFSGVIILASLAVALLSHGYLLYQESEKEEYFIILFTATLGSLLLVAAVNFISLFLGLETLSLSLFVLTAYRRSRDHSIEAGVKYLVLASVSSAFLLFGMGLLYLNTGSLRFEDIVPSAGSSGYSAPLQITGFGMMIVGIGFKLALVPFHMWTPDVYQGAPVPVATYIATISKGAVMALLLRFFFAIRGFEDSGYFLVITILSILSMTIGNFLALMQQNIKRILAYSSIANMGYLLVTLLIGNVTGIHAAIFYIVSYMITSIGAFGVITLLSDRQNEADRLESYKGLFWKRPWIAVVFTLSLLSLAGIPVTTGFIAKFYIVFTGISSGLWLLVISLIVNSVIGLFYYLRVVTALFAQPNEEKFPAVSFTGHVVLAVVTAGIIWLGVFPQGFLALLNRIPGF